MSASIIIVLQYLTKLHHSLYATACAFVITILIRKDYGLSAQTIMSFANWHTPLTGYDSRIAAVAFEVLCRGKFSLRITAQTRPQPAHLKG